MCQCYQHKPVKSLLDRYVKTMVITAERSSLSLILLTSCWRAVWCKRTLVRLKKSCKLCLPFSWYFVKSSKTCFIANYNIEVVSTFLPIPKLVIATIRDIISCFVNNIFYWIKPNHASPIKIEFHHSLHFLFVFPCFSRCVIWSILPLKLYCNSRDI